MKSSSNTKVVFRMCMLTTCLMCHGHAAQKPFDPCAEMLPHPLREGVKATITANVEGMAHGLTLTNIDSKCHKAEIAITNPDHDQRIERILNFFPFLQEYFEIKATMQGRVLEKEDFSLVGAGTSLQGNGFGYRGLHRRGFAVEKILEVTLKERTEK
jgi:hypothetical protein